MQLFYTVRSGDTLSGIANRWAIPLSSLVAANNLQSPYTIYIGQQLAVPPGVQSYRVQEGDSVYRISQLFGVAPAVIIEANQLQPPYMIQSGQLLAVPPGVPYYIVGSGDTLYSLAGRFNVVTGGQRNTELIRQVNQLPNNNLFPGMRLRIPYAPTGDDGLIAYITGNGSELDIWLYYPKTGDIRRLTNGLGAEFSRLVWSQDNQYLAFLGRNRYLYVIHVPTGSISTIDQLEENGDISLDWSPNSQYVGYTKHGEIILYHIRTHQSQRIPQNGATNVQWFPNGTELLFQAPDSSGVSQLFRMNRDGSNNRQVTRNSSGPLHDVQLSPDGTFALYTSPGASISIIFTVDLTTGEVFEIQGGPLAKNYYPTWSPDSTTIAYSATVYDTLGYYSQIRTVGKRGGNERIWAISNCFSTPVTWSPSGESIAYLSGCSEQESASEMWVISLKHPVPIQLAKGNKIMSLQWSPKPVDESLSTFSSLTYKVRFRFPLHWTKVSDVRYQGNDGFFQISAISSDDPIEQVCQNEAFHPLRPYGSMPRITHTTVQGQEACYIIPSADQSAEMKNQAALIVKYPVPIVIGDTTYQYFILWGDQQHILQMGGSLSFV